MTGRQRLIVMRRSSKETRDAKTALVLPRGCGSPRLRRLAGQREAIFGLTLDNSLVVFDSATPGSTSAPIPVTGLAAGQTLVGIDFRPVDRQLVGVAAGAGGVGTVYAINPLSGAATSINPIPVLTGTAFGVDFNPVPNALRIVSDANQNLRIVMGGAGTVNTDGNLNPEIRTWWARPTAITFRAGSTVRLRCT